MLGITNKPEILCVIMVIDKGTLTKIFLTILSTFLAWIVMVRPAPFFWHPALN
jgi:hypothetical protein